MKLFVKLMIALLFIAVMLPFTILRGPDGDTLMSFSRLELPDFSLPEMPAGGKITAPLDGSDGKDIVYKWHDAEGNLHFTTELPPAGIDYSVMGIDPNTNVIQAVKPIEEEEEEKEDEAEQASQTKKTDEIGNPYSPEKIEKLFEDAKNVENLLKQRIKDQEAAINQ